MHAKDKTKKQGTTEVQTEGVIVESGRSINGELNPDRSTGGGFELIAEEMNPRTK